MKKLLFIVLLLLPLLALAQSPFDGTWKIDLNKVQLPKKPDVYKFENGKYACDSCAPKYEVAADGQNQKVTGHPYFDTIAVKVVDDHNVEMTYQRGEKTVLAEKYVISNDEKTLTVSWTDTGQPSGGPINGTTTETRVGKAPSSGNALTGSWRAEKFDENADTGLLYSFKAESADTLSMSTPTGQSYTAKVDGTDAPYTGDPGITSVSLKRTGDSIEETDKRDGKPITMTRMTVAADGKTMNVVVDDKLHGTTTKFVAVKQ